MTKFQSLWSALCSVPNNYWRNMLTPTYLSYNNKTLYLELFLHLIILALEMLQWLYSMQYCSVMIYSGAGVYCLTIPKLQWILKNQSMATKTDFLKMDSGYIFSCLLNWCWLLVPKLTEHFQGPKHPNLYRAPVKI